MQKKLIFLLIVLVPTLLASCDKLNKVINDSQDSIRNSLQEAQDKVVAENNPSVALGHFIDCANGISGSIRIQAGGSPRTAFELYKKRDLSKATAKTWKRADVYFSPDSIKRCQEHISEGIKLKLEGKYSDVLNSAKELLPTLEPFGKTVEQLENYLRSKKYMEDDGKQGQELNELYLQQAPPFVVAFEKFDSALSELEGIRTRDQANAMIKNKKLRAGNGMLAYSNALDALNLASNSDNSPEFQQKFDSYIKGMSDALDQMKAAMDKTQDKRSSKLTWAYEQLSKILGDMREAKGAKFSKSSMKKLSDDYNHFVTFTLNRGDLDE